MSAPSLLVLGTDTGVGKTVATALLTLAYRARGINAVPFKPVASGAELRAGVKQWDDTAFLAEAAGVDEEVVGQYRFDLPMSPHLAAAAQGERVDLRAIEQRYRELADEHEAVLVEGVGGVMVPLNESELFIDLAARLGLPAVVVVRAGLGTLNHALLTVAACRAYGVPVMGLIVSRFPDDPDEVTAANPSELERLCGVPLIGIIPEIDELDVARWQPGALADHIGRLDLGRLDLDGVSADRPRRRVDGLADHAATLAADAAHVWHPFTQMQEYLAEEPHPLLIVAGEGVYLEDSDGKRYIDGTAGMWVNVHGHREPRLDAALRQQLTRIAHSTLLGLANEPSALLAERLAGLAPPGLERVFYSDDGSTAVEVALKIAFQYWRHVGRPEKAGYVSFVNAYHGDTIGAVSLGGIDQFHKAFAPLLFAAHLVPAAYCYRCPVGEAYPGCGLVCLNGLAELLDEDAATIGALIVEPLVQGAAGILVQPPGYLRRVADLCHEHDVLLIVDEVATGFGRTGTLFACEQEGVIPDLMAVAKGITGGYLPLAATLTQERIYEAFLGTQEESKTFFHGHTYTGNPLACAVALANLDLMDENGIVGHVADMSELLEELLEPLADLPHVGDVRLIGLMAGIELVADKRTGAEYPVAERAARRVILKARERGVVIRPLGDVVVLMPPLAIAAAELRELVAVTAWAIAEITGA